MDGSQRHTNHCDAVTLNEASESIALYCATKSVTIPLWTCMLSHPLHMASYSWSPCEGMVRALWIMCEAIYEAVVKVMCRVLPFHTGFTKSSYEADMKQTCCCHEADVIFYFGFTSASQSLRAVSSSCDHNMNDMWRYSAAEGFMWASCGCP